MRVLKGLSLIWCVCPLPPLEHRALPHFPLEEILKRRAQATNLCPIIPPADKCPGVDFVPAQGTQFNSLHSLYPDYAICV